MIKNEQFWQHWRAGEFDKALNCSLEQKPKKKGALLRGISETNTISGISAGEFLYDYLMIDPTVVKGIDFARAEDLSNLFQLSNFASTIDTTVATGDMAQLQGYVAEQMIAQQLIAAGHDVSFPATSNQPGWDLLVDGQPFQVKCGQDKQIVETHFEKYPDTPVIVNEELAAYYADNPLVMTSSITREQVLIDTEKTLNMQKIYSTFKFLGLLQELVHIRMQSVCGRKGLHYQQQRAMWQRIQLVVQRWQLQGKWCLAQLAQYYYQEQVRLYSP